MVIPKKENLIKYILLGMACMVTGGWLVIALGNNPIFWYVGSFLGMCFLVTVNAFNQTIWQSVVKSEHRGKVLGARAWIAQSLYPLGFMISGLLVDRVFESQTISQYAHWLPSPSTFSIGPGSGSAVLLILTSLIMYAVLCIGWILTQTTTGKFD
jgi:hypothetical protein